MLPALTATGLANLTVCHPRALSLTKVAAASLAPAELQSFPVWVPALPAPL